LISAYISGGSELFNSLFKHIGISLPYWLDAVIFVAIFGYIVVRGIHFVDYANRGLMIAKLGSLIILILFSIPYIDHQALTAGNPRVLTGVVTVMLTSFGFANIIPSLRSYFNDDVKSLRKAVVIGSLIPLTCYILWDLAIIGSLPRTQLIAVMNRGGSVAELMELLGSHLNNSYITVVASFFTAICVLTAFLCVSLALSDFLADGLKVEKKGKGNWLIYSLTFLPSLIIILFYPSIFVKALRYAGICCVVLIILLPALMAFSGRYWKKIAKGYEVKGGKGALILVMLIAIFILIIGVKEVIS